MGRHPAHAFASSRGLLGVLVLLTAAGQVLEAERAPDIPSLSMSLRDNVVVSVLPGGAAARAGIHEGDLITAVEGRAATATRSAGRILGHYGAGDTVQVDLRRASLAGGPPEDLRIAFVPTKPQRIEVLWRLALAGVGITTLMIGFLVFSKKPRQLTLIFAGICYGMGYLFHPPYVPLDPVLQGLRNVLMDAVTVLIPPLLIHLFLLFPFRHPILERRPLLPLLLYAPSVLLLALVQSVRLVRPDPATGHLLAAISQLAATLLWVAGCAVALWLFVRSYVRAQTETARAQVRVALWGTVLGLFPLSLVLLLRLLWPTLSVPGDRLSVLATVLVPLSFGYAIVRHGIFDATHIVRRSLVLTGGGGLILLVYFGTQLLLQSFLEPIPISTLWISFISMLLAALLFWAIRGHLRALLKRVAGEERREQQQLLYDLGQALRGVTDRGDLVRAVASFLREALRSDRVAYFEWIDRDTLEATYVDGVEAERLDRFRFSRNLTHALDGIAGPVDRGDLEMDLPFGYLSPSDQRVLAALDTDIVVPVRVAQQRFGVLSVGQQTLGDPFSAEDLQLAETIAAEGAVAMENAALHDRLRRQDLLRHEVARAGDLQRRLLPTELPVVDSFEISGFSIPAQGVGGDYYDCFRTKWGEILLAIGDASGKSVSGAILMANLHGLVKSEAQRSEPPQEIVARINRRVCEMRKPDRYVTFCLARVDPLTGTLAYCNAGHPGLMLVRVDGRIEELSQGGLPLGIQAEAAYDGGSTFMRAGDVLLAYTDGITERERGEEMFGEERLREIARTHRRMSAQALQQTILAAVQGFSSTPLDDDTTLLLVKML